ncbi:MULTISPECIES: Ezrin/radixin/moesin family protein [Flammeovirga]|uniref:Ezrin/radixin/moesin family protein n=1 Tax=Flammeovirga agarivorans TaxID=2726742 RepID=A0A7X8XZ54_9BACT|nr:MULTISPECIES: Ezrin/radixin/moesin family protein [Flammeovirga]NLR94743.1 Ezrin/radixin/moesin family protein [Flammeovirga agarivorans]
MRRIFILLLVAFSVVAFDNDAFAQKKKKKDKGGNDKKSEKKEIKEWKKKLKETDPLKFRDMTQELNTLRGQASGLKAEISKLEQEKETFNQQLKEKDNEIADLKAELAKLKKKMDNNVSASGDDYTKGVVYKVQVGAFKNRDLSKFQDKGNFWMEDQDGLKKYTIAYFRDYGEADQFKKYMRAMGVKDAWIVAYEDNTRKDIKDVQRKSGR